MSTWAKIFKTDNDLSLLLREKGIASIAELARLCNMKTTSITNAVNGKPEFIYGVEQGTYRKPARRIAEVLGTHPEILFGDDPRIEARQRKMEVLVGNWPENLVDRSAISPEDSAIQSTLRDATTRVLASLTPREERVLRQRFGIAMNTEHTKEEVLGIFSVSRERIREIEAKSLRKLKHPSASRKLRSFLEDKPKERDWLKGFEPKP